MFSSDDRFPFCSFKSNYIYHSYMGPGQPLNEKSIYDRGLDLISYICTVITGVMLVVLTVIFGWLVFGRYVLNATPTWVEVEATPWTRARSGSSGHSKESRWRHCCNWPV